MNKIFCTEVDEQGFIIGTHLLTEEETRSFKGLLLVGVMTPTGSITQDRPLKPKWENDAWVEGATATEIQEYYDSLPANKSETQILKERLDATEAAILQIILEGGGIL